MADVTLTSGIPLVIKALRKFCEDETGNAEPPNGTFLARLTRVVSYPQYRPRCWRKIVGKLKDVLGERLNGLFVRDTAAGRFIS
jgi:hypothetical protein